MTRVMTGYRFVRLTDLAKLQAALEDATAALPLKGTILLAGEGINVSLAGPAAALESFRRHLESYPALQAMRWRFSSATPGNGVFDRLKVRIKPEIVQLNQPGVEPERRTGEHVDARRWNELLDEPDVVVLDVRNRYEITFGTFPGARDPGTEAFSELPAYVREHLGPGRHPRVAMFCTGGIRCEKASSWLLDQGFQHVYQLDGGVLGYLETVSPGESRWQGECFVFDQRVSVDAHLDQGSFDEAPLRKRAPAPR